MQLSPRLFFLSILLFFLSLTTATGQINTISFSDEQGKPLEGVFVVDQKGNHAEISDAEGKIYLDKFNPQATLDIQFLGYESMQIVLAELKQDKISLRPLPLFFDEFVIKADDNRPLSQQIQEIDIIRPDALQNGGAQSSADLLQQSGSVFVQKSQMGGGSPVLRGFEANRILLIVDGVKMNNAIYRSGHLQNSITVSSQALASVDVIQGPASLIYGSDALGGVIHYHTQKPEYSKKSSGISHKGSFNTLFSTANKGSLFSVKNELSGKKWSSLNIISFSNFNDLRSGSRRSIEHPDFGKRFFYQDFINGKDSIVLNLKENAQGELKENYNLQVGSAYSQMDLLQKFRFQLHPDLELGVNLQYSNSSNIPRYDQLVETDSEGKPRFAEWDYGPQERILYALHLNYNRSNRFFDKSRLTLAAQDIEESRIVRRFNQPNRTHNTEQLNVFSLNNVFQKRFETKRKQQIFYGIEAQFNDLNSGGFVENINGDPSAPFFSRYPSGKATSLNTAAYFNHSISSKNQTTQLNTGLRYAFHQTSLQFENSPEFSWPSSFTDGSMQIVNKALVGGIALRKRLTTTQVFDLSLSSAYRAPNIDDLGKIRIKGDFVNVPNPDIDAEKTLTLDAGYTLTEKVFKLRFNSFFTRANDLLVRKPTDTFELDNYTSVANTNAKDGFIYGLNSRIDYKLNQSIQMHYQVALTKGRYRFESSETSEKLDTLVAMGHIPPMFGSGGITLQKGNMELSLIHRFNAKKSLADYEVVDITSGPNGTLEIEREGSSDNIESGLFDEHTDGQRTYLDLPAWQTFNFYLRWTKGKSVFSIAVENVLDRHYRSFSSGISAPGINLSLGLSYKF